MPRHLAVDISGTLRAVRAFIREDPLVAAAAIALILLGLLMLILLIRHFRRPPGVRLKRVLARPEGLTILMHPNPDPDAMASALGLAHLAARAGTPVDMRYSGQIRHQENRAFRTVLDCEFNAVERAHELGPYPVVLVDHNIPRGFDGCAGIEPYAVIDHHPGDGTGSAFTDVRPSYGASASIIAEYFEDLGLEPVDPDAPENHVVDGLPSLIATGLLYGILADTNHLTKGCSPAEFKASAYLYPGVDEEALDRISNPQVDAEVLDVKARAITEREIKGPFAVSDVGEVSNVDAIPQAADELLALEGITAVVVMGQKDGTLHLSGRSRDDRVHMGNVLNEVLDDVPMASGGGHARMGGGQASLAHLEGLLPGSGWSIDEFAGQLFDAMTGDV